MSFLDIGEGDCDVNNSAGVEVDEDTEFMIANLGDEENRDVGDDGFDDAAVDDSDDSDMTLVVMLTSFIDSLKSLVSLET